MTYPKSSYQLSLISSSWYLFAETGTVGGSACTSEFNVSCALKVRFLVSPSGLYYL